ncbi:MAG: hypothetical protein JRI74_00715 [Deltaproteobacteria bacterium]|nr:hypothetical protein [Deltaproteobacteria bacterium]
MIFALHGNQEKFAWKRLQGSIKTLISDNDIEVMRSKETLAKRLSQVTCGQAIVVLITADRQDLTYFLSIIQLLRKARVLLVIPNQEPEAVRIGYKLEPRFLTTESENYSEVRAVLRNMVKGEKDQICVSTQKPIRHDYFLSTEELGCVF